MMRKVLYCLAVFAIVASAGVLQAQSQLSSADANNKASHDRPIGKVRIKLPVANGTANPGELPPPPPPPPPPIVPPEHEDIPPDETPPQPPEPEDPPTYFGEPVQFKIAFVLDASGSMAGSRIASLRSETTGVIGALTDDHSFDVVAYGTQFPQGQAYSKFMWGSLLEASDGNKSAAISWVNGSSLNPGGGTPTYACLQKSCQVYPADLDQMFLVTDGAPNVSGSASQILSDFPAWWQKFDHAEMVAICIGGNSSAQTFMQQLAAEAGGTYIAA